MSKNLMRKQVVKVGKMVNLPDSWRVKQIKETLDLESGVWDKENKEGYPVLRSTNFSETGYIDFDDVTYRDIPERKIEDKKLKKGDILLEISGGGPKQPVGRVVYFYDDKEKEYLFGNFVKRLRLKDKISEENDPYYIFRFLERFYDIGQTETLQHQTTGIRNLDYRAYMSLPLPLPPLPEQKKIASILSSVDKSIEKTDEVIEETKELKKGLMQELLTKGIGHSEFKEVFWGLKKVIIPKKWSFYDVTNACSKIIDYRGRTPEYSDDGIIHLRSNNIKDGIIKYEDIKYVSNETYNDFMTRGIPKENDVLFVMEGSIGETAVVPKNLKFSLAQRLIILRPKNKVSNGLYLKYLFNSYYFVTEAYRYSTGSTIRGIASKRLKKIKFPLPSVEEQKKIASILSSVDAKIKKEEEYKSKLERLKKGLMQKLLTGEIRVNTEMEV